MLQLDGDRLPRERPLRRVINRNNRLAQLLELGTWYHRSK